MALPLQQGQFAGDAIVLAGAGWGIGAGRAVEAAATALALLSVAMIPKPAMPNFVVFFMFSWCPQHDQIELEGR
jgi:hypothetical protein